MTTTRQYAVTNHAKYIKKFLCTPSVPDVVYTVGVNSTYTERKAQKMLETSINNPLTQIALMALILLLIRKPITEITQGIIVKQEIKKLSRILNNKNASEAKKEHAIETFRQNI